MGSTCIRSASKAVSSIQSDAAAAATGHHHQLSSAERDGAEGESSYVSCDESKRRNRSTSVSFSEVAIRIINGEKSSSVDEQGGGSPHEESLTSSTVAVVGGDDDEMGANQSADVHFLKNLTALHPDAQLVANGQAEAVPVSLENSSTSSLTAGTKRGSSRRLLPSHHKRIHPPLSSEGAQRCSEESDMAISDSMWIAVHRQVDCLEEQQGGGDGESSPSSGQLIVFAFDDDTCGGTGAYRVN